MLNKNRLLSISGIAVLLACGFACAQENTSKQNGSSNNQNSNQSKEKISSDTPKSSEVQGGAISKEEIRKVSEAFGHFIGRNLKTPGINFDLESIIKGMRDGYEGKPAPMSDKEYEELMAKIQEQAFSQLSSHNLKEANDFLEKNAKAAGIVVVEPGKLEYSILQDGNGSAVTEHSSPQIKYTGKFLDGTVFGSSEETGGPITIPLDQTIPGFSKGIVGMKEGEKRKLFVHPDLGYGTTGHLPPNSLLIFEVEVVKAQSPEAGQNQTADFGELTLDDAMFDEDQDDDFDDEDDNSKKTDKDSSKK